MANFTFTNSTTGNMAAGVNVTQTNTGPVEVSTSFKYCLNTVKGISNGQVRDALCALVAAVEQINSHLSEDEQKKAEARLISLTTEATLAKPEKDQLVLSGKGLLEAAESCAQMAAPVISAVKTVLTLFKIALP